MFKLKLNSFKNIFHYLGTLIILTIFGFISCENKPQKDLEVISLQFTQTGKVEIYDSLSIENNSGLLLIDYEEESKIYLLFDLFTQEILVLNEKGKPISNFNNAGQGPEQYDQIRATGFFSSNEIIIIGAWAYKIYDLEGKYIKGEKFGNGILAEAQLYSAIQNFSDNNSNQIIVIKGGEFNAEKVSKIENNIDNNWITLVNTTNHNSISGVKFEADFYKEKAFPVEKTPFYTINKTDKLLHVVFPLEKYIYTYDLENLEILSKTPTNASFFTEPQGLPLKQSKNYAALNKVDLLNSKYKGIYNLGDNLILTSYETQVSESLISDKDSEELFFERQKSRKKYLQLFKGLTKVVADIKIPKGFALVGGFSLNHLILEKDDIQNDEAITYYKARINLVDN